MNHMIRHHILVPLGIFVVLLAVGVPAGTAFVVGMMAGCMSMVFMGGHGSHHEHGNAPSEHQSERQEG